MILSFIKQDGLWYADIPEYLEHGGYFSDCLMVAGAPEFIESMAGDKATSAVFEVSTEWFPGFEAILNKVVEGTVLEEEGSWGTYLATKYDIASRKGDTLPSITRYVGLCPVNQFVFDGRHPNTIYLRFIEQ